MIDIKRNNARNTLFLLKQFGFTDKTLESIYKHEDLILEVIYDINHPFYNKYYELYTEKEKELSTNFEALGKFSREFIEKMRTYKEKGIKVYFSFEKDYPSYLFEKGKEPLFLYCYGNTSLLRPEKRKVSIIGTRQPTTNGIEATKRYVKRYVEENWITVSGLAKGIDTIVHSETLNYQGSTIAVVPTSFERVYPKENEALYKKIISNNGLIISTYGPFENTYKSNFLERNTIVANISDEILVIEASIKSGTLNTVRHGYKFGKKILYDSDLLKEEVISYIERFNAINLKTKGRKE